VRHEDEEELDFDTPQPVAKPTVNPALDKQKEMIEKQRIEREKIEKQRIEKEKLEKENIDRERLENERIERGKSDKEDAKKGKSENEKNEQKNKPNGNLAVKGEASDVDTEKEEDLKPKQKILKADSDIDNDDDQNDELLPNSALQVTGKSNNKSNKAKPKAEKKRGKLK